MRHRILRIVLSTLALCSIVYMIPTAVHAATDCAWLTGYVIPRTECDALVEFYNSTVWSGWTQNTGRVTNTSACNWTGVSCTSITGNFYVSSISLASNNLSGTLNSSLGNLAHLTTLILSSNHLRGSLPTAWSWLTQLNYVYFPYNELTWSLPSSWSTMTAMGTFFVEWNNLNWSLPESRSSMTQMFDFVIGDNNFSGPLPEAYAAWTWLYRFSASTNNLSWTLPISRSWWRNINTFYVDANPNIGWTLPREWASWAATIDVFGIGTNVSSMTQGIGGTLPTEWSVWTGMTAFYVQWAQITWTLPASWSGWRGIEDIRIYSTPLRGEIPSSWSSRTAPRLFYLYDTYVNGSFASAFTHRSGTFETRLHDNCLLTVGLETGTVTRLNAYSGTDRTDQRSCLDIAVEKTVNQSTAQIWNILTYTITYTILSGTNITWFTLYDVWNTGLTLSSSSLAINGSGVYTWTLASSLSWMFAWNWNINNITRGWVWSITLTSLIPNSFAVGDTIYNRVVVQDGFVDLETGDNLDTISTVIVASYGGGGGSSLFPIITSGENIKNWGTTGGAATNQPTPIPWGVKEIHVSTTDNPRDCGDAEFNTAYVYASALNITTMETCMSAMMSSLLLRKHAAKMLTEFAIHALNKVPDESRSCAFTDMEGEDEEMRIYAKAACQLGLMGLNGQGDAKTTFSPNEYVTIAQMGTIISRLLRWDTNNVKDESNTCRYCEHLAALKAHGIMNVIDEPSRFILRWWLMIMMERVSHMSL